MKSAKDQPLSLQWLEPQLCSGCTASNNSLTLAPSKKGLIRIYVHILKLHCVIRCGRMQKQNPPLYISPMRVSANYLVFA